MRVSHQGMRSPKARRSCRTDGRRDASRRVGRPASITSVARHSSRNLVDRRHAGDDRTGELGHRVAERSAGQSNGSALATSLSASAMSGSASSGRSAAISGRLHTTNSVEKLRSAVERVDVLKIRPLRTAPNRRSSIWQWSADPRRSRQERRRRVFQQN